MRRSRLISFLWAPCVFAPLTMVLVGIGMFLYLTECHVWHPDGVACGAAPEPSPEEPICLRVSSPAGASMQLRLSGDYCRSTTRRMNNRPVYHHPQVVARVRTQELLPDLCFGNFVNSSGAGWQITGDICQEFLEGPWARCGEAAPPVPAVEPEMFSLDLRRRGAAVVEDHLPSLRRVALSSAWAAAEGPVKGSTQLSEDAAQQAPADPAPAAPGGVSGLLSCAEWFVWTLMSSKGRSSESVRRATGGGDGGGVPALAVEPPVSARWVKVPLRVEVCDDGVGACYPTYGSWLAQRSSVAYVALLLLLVVLVGGLVGAVVAVVAVRGCEAAKSRWGGGDARGVGLGFVARRVLRRGVAPSEESVAMAVVRGGEDGESMVRSVRSPPPTGLARPPLPPSLSHSRRHGEAGGPVNGSSSSPPPPARGVSPRRSLTTSPSASVSTPSMSGDREASRGRGSLTRRGVSSSCDTSSSLSAPAHEMRGGGEGPPQDREGPSNERCDTLAPTVLGEGDSASAGVVDPPLSERGLALPASVGAACVGEGDGGAVATSLGTTAPLAAAVQDEAEVPHFS